MNGFFNKLAGSYHKNHPTSKNNDSLWKKLVATVAGLVVLQCTAFGVVVDASPTPQQLVKGLMGAGITVQNVTYAGAPVSKGTFTGGFADGLGLDSGVILSSGNISTAVGPNDSSGAGLATSGQSDRDLEVLAGTATKDAAVLEFDFIPTSGQVQFQYIFASEEYTEYIGDFNDVMGIFVNGRNIALVPQTLLPVGVNTITPDLNETFYVDNEQADFGTQFDGFTTVLTATAAVTNGVLAHVKIGIADATDQVWDSAAFLSATLPECFPPEISRQPQSQIGCLGMDVNFSVEAGGSAPLTFQWKKDGQTLTDGGNISGSSTPALTVATAGAGDLGTYTVTISNPCGSVTSTGATLALNTGHFTSVAAAIGSYHSLALKDDGTVWSTGHNGSGQLGDGTTVAQVNRVQVSGLTGATAIGSGRYCSFAIVSGGAVRAWGENGNGQLGDGTTVRKLTPVPVTGLSGVIAVAGGASHTIALKSDGTVWGWGYNGYGQLGDGTTVQRNTPVQASGLTGIIAIAAGSYHNLALKDDGTVWAWGNNTSGRLGDGTTTVRYTPVQVSCPPNINLIAAGDQYSLASVNGGFVWGWGAGWNGQIGDGGQSAHLLPVQSSVSGAVALVAGGAHSLVLDSSGRVWGFGMNNMYQLGDGTTAQRLTPVEIGLSGVTQLAATYYSSYAVTADHNIWGWGYNANGQLGDGTRNNRTVPALTVDYGPPHINSQPTKRSVCPGSSTTLTVEAKGSPTLVYQWKKNNVLIAGATASSYTIANATVNQAGLYTVDVIGPCGSVTSESAAVTVGGPMIITDPQSQTICPGQYFYFAVAANGTGPLSYQWYFNGDEIADATSDYYEVDEGWEEYGGDYSVLVTGPCGSTMSGTATLTVDQFGITEQPQIQTVCFGGNATFTVGAIGADLTYRWRKNGQNLNDGGTISGATSSTLTLTGVTLADAGTYTVAVNGRCASTVSTAATLTVSAGSYLKIAAGWNHSLALKADGSVWSTGHNGSGQLGDGTTVAQISRIQVPGLSGVVAVGAGRYYSFAVKSDGTAWAWGENGNGQLGDGTTVRRLSPTQVSGVTGIVAIGGGNAHGLALKNDGTVWAWGYNGYGQIGDGTTIARPSPVQVSGLTQVVAIAAGGYHNLALKSDGTVWAWGKNASGQLGDGTQTTRYVPTQVASVTGIGVIAAGEEFSLAAQTGGNCWGWGFGWNGALGNGSQGYFLTPVQSSISGVVKLAAGYRHSLAITIDGSVWAWGGNESSQLGNGTTQQIFLPASIGQDGMAELAASYSTSYAVGANRSIWGWGANFSGQLGDGTRIQYSTPALTTDDGPPHINTHPRGQSICLGSSATLTVAARGGPVLTYQWKLDGVAINNATASSYTIPAATQNDGGVYTVDVNGACGSVTSHGATVAIGGPIILSQPQGATVPPGGRIELQVVADGTGPLTYQWYLNNDEIPGATGSLYKHEVWEDDAGDYFVIISGPCESTQSETISIVVE